MYTIFHAAAGYIFMLFIVRLLSRRPGAQTTLSEFVLIFLIGGILILATLGDDHSEINSVCAVITVGLMHRSVSWLRIRFPRFGKIVDGTPLVAFKQGQPQQEVMQQMHLADEDLLAAARTKGVKTAKQIKYAILERNGAISVIKADSTGE